MYLVIIISIGQQFLGLGNQPMIGQLLADNLPAIS